MNALTPTLANNSELVVTLERARTAFDAGDVQTAFILSSGAYEQAKAAGLMDRLFADGLVSEPDKAGQRVVFMDKLEGAA